MRAFIVCAALLALLGCGGGGGGGSGGGGGGGNGDASDEDFSVGAIGEAFPSLDEGKLKIQQGQITKWYYYASKAAVSDYASALLDKGFSSSVTNCGGSPYDRSKVLDKGSKLACAEINQEGDFNLELLKIDGSPSGSEVRDVYGDVPGDIYYVDRIIVATYDSAFENAADSYKDALESPSNGFTCLPVSGYIECYKTNGNLKYEVLVGGVMSDGTPYGVIQWSIYGGKAKGIANEASCSVETNISYFDPNDYIGNPNAAFASDDRLAVYQWHLKNWGQKSGTSYGAKTVGEDINVTKVWEDGIKGEDVTIGIVDNGTDFTHPDLAPTHDPSLSRNYYSHLNDPYPVKADCSHGTATAGIAGARGGNGGVMGVAPKANLAGLNIGLGCGGYMPYTTDVADALSAAVDISSNSWGSSAPTAVDETLDNAIIEGAATGRGGKGTVYVFAAGNDRSHNANGNYDPTQSLFQSISVAALASDGKYAKYSNKGANLLVSAYGASQTSTASGNAADDAWIFTTDVYGCAKGENLYGQLPHALNDCGQYNAKMNGTSAAAPMVSGVVALMLEAKPSLTWRDVRYILATTARKNDPTNSDWKKNGAGYLVNHNYGFGAVDAYSAVEKAKTFTSLGALITREESETVNSSVTFNTTPREETLTFSGSGIDKIEYVDVWVDINDYSYATKLNVTLISPSGTTSELAYDTYSGTWTTGIYDGGFRFGTARHLDESADGTWTLKISSGSSQTRLFRNWKIKIYGRSN
ncbi:MAG: S8 family serine peptidase [Helicobacteraceae bacterium]|jgi:kexin|nr:S8 family serine peptidase [Helicobacteraceae bacterium]